jgi:hypothetical protein
MNDLRRSGSRLVHARDYKRTAPTSAAGQPSLEIWSGTIQNRLPSVPAESCRVVLNSACTAAIAASCLSGDASLNCPISWVNRDGHENSQTFALPSFGAVREEMVSLLVTPLSAPHGRSSDRTVQFLPHSGTGRRVWRARPIYHSCWREQDTCFSCRSYKDSNNGSLVPVVTDVLSR